MVHNLDVEPKRKKQKVASNNTSGYKGVSKSKSSGKFRVLISIGNGKQKRLGTFDTAIQAALAYDQAAIKAGKKKSTLNFPDGLPPIKPIKQEPTTTPLPSRTLANINTFCNTQNTQWNNQQERCAYSSAGLLDFLRNRTEVGLLPPIASTNDIGFTFETEDDVKSPNYNKNVDLVMTEINASKANIPLRKLIEREMHILDSDDEDSDKEDGGVTYTGERVPRQWVSQANVKDVFVYLKTSINQRKSEELKRNKKLNNKTEEGCGLLLLPGIDDGIGHILAWVELTDGTPIIVDPTLKLNTGRCFHDGHENTDYLSIETFERFYRDDVKVQIEPIFVLWCAGGKLSEVAQELHSISELEQNEIAIKKEPISSSSSSSFAQVEL